MSNEKKPEEKKAESLSVNDDIKKLIAEALKQGRAEGMAMAAMMQKGTQAPPPQYIPGELCADCRQEKRHCKGEHVKMAVFPQERRLGKWFQGVKLNGVLYLSNHANHEITVPKHNDFASIISTWEENERVTAQGRVAEHDSGEVNARGGRTNRATGGWR